MNPIVVAAPALAAGCYILALQIKHRHTTDEALLDEARPGLAQKLLPYIGTPEELGYLEKEALWTAIGGIRGLLEIHRAAGAIGTLAARRARQSPIARTEAEALFVAAIYMRFIVLLAIVEAVTCRTLPMLPRVFAGAMAKMYCDMAAGIEAVESIHSFI